LLYVLLGEDDFSLRQSLEKIKESVGDQTVLAANTTVLDGQQVTLDQLRAACETVPFLAEKRLVIIEGLLGRFESKGKSRRKKTKHLSDQKNGYESIVAYVSQVPDFTMVVLIDGKIKSQNPLLTELFAKGEVRAFPLLKEPQLRQWIQRRITEAGGTISPPAVDVLAKFVGSNLWLMASEIEKLVLFTAGRRIEEEDIRALVSYAQEANVFSMVDAILESKAGLAQRLLAQLLQQGVAPTHLLVMIARQTRMLVQVKELRNRRKSRVEIQNKLGLTLEFVLRKALEQAGKYSLTRLKEVYHKLLEADLAIKTGKCEEELVLNILIAELCQGSKA